MKHICDAVVLHTKVDYQREIVLNKSVTKRLKMWIVKLIAVEAGENLYRPDSGLNAAK